MINENKYYIKIGNTYVTLLIISEDHLISSINASSDKTFAKKFDYDDANKYADMFGFEIEKI